MREDLVTVSGAIKGPTRKIDRSRAASLHAQILCLYLHDVADDVEAKKFFPSFVLEQNNAGK